MKINWTKVKDEFYKDCTFFPINGSPIKKVNMAPHDLFNWFKEKLTPKTRTLNQNSSLHLWLTEIAELINETGQQHYNEMGVPTIYTMERLKRYWKDSLKDTYNIESTKEMTSKILNEMIEGFTVWFIENKGIEVPEFPNKQRLLMELEKKGKLK